MTFDRLGLDAVEASLLFGERENQGGGGGVEGLLSRAHGGLAMASLWRWAVNTTSEKVRTSWLSHPEIY